MKYFFLSLSVAFNLGSYILYKAISSRTNDAVWFILFSLGLALGAVNTFFFTKALKTMNLSIAYPIFSAACIALMVVVSILFFHEKVSTLNVVGFFVVAAGIAMVMS